MLEPRWAYPSQKEADGLKAYQAFVLLHCVIAMNIVVPLTQYREAGAHYAGISLGIIGLAPQKRF